MNFEDKSFDLSSEFKATFLRKLNSTSLQYFYAFLLTEVIFIFHHTKPPTSLRIVHDDSNTGERIAAGINSGQTVTHSVPGLKQPTNSATAGRTPAARPPLLQLKSGRGMGQRPTSLLFGREAHKEAADRDDATASALLVSEPESLNLDDFAIQQIRQVFELLNTWDTL